jgi:hypothetical protein
MAPNKILTGIACSIFLCISLNLLHAQERFADDFERDLSGWQLVGAHAIQLVDSNDPQHGRVMQLQPDGAVYALIKNSHQWGGVRVEGEVLFLDGGDNYLGLIYNYTQREARTDFGSIYIKGNGSYVQVNPWWDGNASRLLYNEYTTRLIGKDSIHIKTWHHFKAEITGNVCHFYVGDMTIPKLAFDLLELTSGLVGFKPRIVGTPVWIDNIKVTSINRMSYQGPKIPAIKYEPDSLITAWEVIGPLSKPVEAIERATEAAASTITANGVTHVWQPFKVDARGAVITGSITEYNGSRPVAYFRTRVYADKGKTATLHLSTTDELALFVNGRFDGFIYRDGYVSGKNDWNTWFDFWKNPEHAGRKVPIQLKSGTNQIVLRVRNGQFASGGFFARLESF